MIKITASLVKKLREQTGLGIIDCKKALIETNGNIQLAIENIRKFAMIDIARKKISNVASNGIVVTKIDGNYGFILEVNCQTDFVAKNSDFQMFSKRILDAVITKKITDIEMLKVHFEEERTALIAKIGENITIRRVAFLKSEALGFYQHGTRIGVLVATTKDTDKILVKQLAMHIAANKPAFINPEDIPIDMMKKEYQFQLNVSMQSGNLKEIAERIAADRIKKFTEEISLTKQLFVMDQSKSVAQLLKEHNTNVIDFIRFEVGERIKTGFSEKSTSTLYENSFHE